MMILGLVKLMQPVHGYDVRRELLSWNADEWANVAPGSIYHALRKLTEEGLLEEVATEQVGARPARTTYRTTAKGDSEFEDLLRDYWWQLSSSRSTRSRPRSRSCPRCRGRGGRRRAAQPGAHAGAPTADGLAAAIDSAWMHDEAGPRAAGCSSARFS